MLLNFCYADDRLTRRIRGERVTDPEEQYRKLVKMRPEIEKLHQKGQIDEKRYRSYVDAIEDYESRGE